MAEFPGYVQCLEDVATHLTFEKLEGQVLPIQHLEGFDHPVVVLPVPVPFCNRVVTVYGLKLVGAAPIFLKKAEPEHLDGEIEATARRIRWLVRDSWEDFYYIQVPEIHGKELLGKRVRVTLDQIEEEADRG